MALIWCLLAANSNQGGLLGVFADGPIGWLLGLWPIAMGLAVIWTLASGLEYIWRAWPLLRSSWAPRPVAGGPPME